MSYVRENGLARARRRRERRSMAILVFSLLLVVGAIVFAAAFMSRPTVTSNPCATPTKTVAPPEASFALNVYNAGGKKGAAGTTADALRTHNFNVSVVSNDPYRKTITGVGEVRFGPEGASLAKQYVAKYAPGAKLVEDGRDGKSVDVVVGPNFPTITPAPKTESPSVSCDPSKAST